MPTQHSTAPAERFRATLRAARGTRDSAGERVLPDLG
jgi:hypothetical protein